MNCEIQIWITFSIMCTSTWIDKCLFHRVSSKTASFLFFHSARPSCHVWNWTFLVLLCGKYCWKSIDGLQPIMTPRRTTPNWKMGHFQSQEDTRGGVEETVVHRPGRDCCRDVNSVGNLSLCLSRCRYVGLSLSLPSVVGDVASRFHPRSKHQTACVCECVCVGARARVCRSRPMKRADNVLMVLLFVPIVYREI